ncbi:MULTISPECIES: cobalamin-dependent protein [unclassified Roseitalea]|uniref:cobalamin B12-binding domain-containing protein n=1 Tax=unclassified Roseitalea TaxID=2639107 RepID=UPI00273EFDE9|nr:MULTISPECIES: cobalamin-dependent protein [unclassified Roseitalea]
MATQVVATNNGAREGTAAAGNARSEEVKGVAGIEPDTLLEAFLVSDQTFLDTVVPTLLSHSVSLLVFYRAIVRPVATRLGDMWCEDEIDFVKVEVVSTRLRLMCNQLVSRRMTGHAPLLESPDKRVLLANAGGDQHTLGFSLAEAFFQDAGWFVGGGFTLTPGEEYFDALAQGDYFIVALALNRDDVCDPADLVARSRAASCNRDILICLGGTAVSGNPDRYRVAGADVVAVDAPDAVRQAEAALGRRSGAGNEERVGEPMLDKVVSGADAVDDRK